MKKLILVLAMFLVAGQAHAARTAEQVLTDIEYCRTHGIDAGDPVEVQGDGDEVGTVVCVFPDINASLDPPAYIGVKKILLITE